MNNLHRKNPALLKFLIMAGSVPILVLSVGSVSAGQTKESSSPPASSASNSPAHGASTAQADQPQDNRPTLSLSPAVVMARGSFGQTLAQTLTLSNQTSNAFTFEMVAEDVVLKDGKRVFVPAGETPGSIAASAVFSQKAGLVKPFSTVSVDVRLTIPAETDLRAVVAVFRGTSAVMQAQSSVALTASLGALVTFNLTDHLSVEGEPVRVNAASPNANLSVAEWLRNAGSEPVFPEGVAAFLNAHGTLVAKVPFPAQRLLPGERLEFSAEYPGQLAAGTYKVLCSFQYEGKDLTNATTFKAP